MHASPIRLGFAFALLVWAASPAAAQFSKPKVKIADARVGLPASKFTGERDDGGVRAERQ